MSNKPLEREHVNLGPIWMDLHTAFVDIGRAIYALKREVERLEKAVCRMGDAEYDGREGALHRIRRESSLVAVVSEHTTLKKRGKKWVGLCPFHEEKIPSFTIDEKQQLYYCFGCGVGGDVFSFIMDKLDMDLTDAMRWLDEFNKGKVK